MRDLGARRPAGLVEPLEGAPQVLRLALALASVDAPADGTGDAAAAATSTPAETSTAADDAAPALIEVRTMRLGMRTTSGT